MPIYHFLCDCVQIALFFVIGWMQDVREALNSFMLERSIVCRNTVLPAPGLWEHFKHCSFIMLITNDLNPHGANRWFWFHWCDRDDLKEMDLMSFTKLCFPWESWNLASILNQQTAMLKESKVIQGFIVVWVCGFLRLWFTYLCLDVYCLLYIKDVCNAWRKPFVSIPIHLEGSCSAGVRSTWFEICYLRSWEPQKCSCASWSSRAEWKCKLITLYSRPLWPMLNLDTYTLLF